MKELTLVVSKKTTLRQIAWIGSKIGLTLNRTYHYAGNQDAVFYVKEEDVSRVSAILDGIAIVQSYTFIDDTYAQTDKVFDVDAFHERCRERGDAGPWPDPD